MANYLERVASSAGHRAAVAKPPSSGPPLLPTKDLSLPAEGLLPSDDEQFFEPVSQRGPDRRESLTRAEELPDVAPIINERPGTEPEAAKLRDDLTPAAKSPVARESLSSEPPFTVHLPKTLRPIADTKIQPEVASEQQSGAPPHPAKADSTESVIDEIRGPVIESASDSVVRESVTFAVKTEQSPVQAQIRIAGPTDEQQPPIQRQTEIEAAAVSGTPSVRPVGDTSDKVPAPLTSHRGEPLPLPPAALPVHLPSPSVVGGAARQEQSRISIGSLEVLVNNHPPAAPARPPVSTPSPNEKANLERRYLDRFRLRR